MTQGTNHVDDGAVLPIIVVDQLRKRYGDVQAVDGVSFSVGKGEVFALLGPNGSGKTTTVEIIEGMRTADSGTATVGGIDVRKDARAVKQLIGVQLQSSAFFEHLNLSELLKMLGSIYGVNVDPDPLLDAVELGEKRKASFRTLSGGQKQRFAIAASLVNDPKVIFLDEPTTGLDPQARRRMWELVLQWKAAGRTVMLTTHYMEEAEELCDRVAVMDRGSIIALESPDALIDDLIGRGFTRTQVVRPATLEDVFLDLTGRSLRET
jgi:ABC-2 type transport system ATP-binding protein